jgi:hypothetical protein
MTIMGGDASHAAAQILDEHVYLASGRCSCDWQGEADRHAAHVLHELAMAGLDVVWR